MDVSIFFWFIPSDSFHLGRLGKKGQRPSGGPLYGSMSSGRGIFQFFYSLALGQSTPCWGEMNREWGPNFVIQEIPTVGIHIVLGALGVSCCFDVQSDEIHRIKEVVNIKGGLNMFVRQSSHEEATYKDLHWLAVSDIPSGRCLGGQWLRSYWSQGGRLSMLS